MVTLEKYGFFGILLFVAFFRSSHTFIKRCPEMAELVIYSKDKCKNNHKEYHCLALHRTELNNYKEECRTPEWVSLGNYPVFRGRYIDYETCPTTSYQPFLFRSNERYKCTYLKSKCSSDGQVEVNDGTTSSNKACRCDYNRGFAFVIRPKNQCACIPSKEDCSCYLKRCAEGQQLNPDYQCTNRTVLPGKGICQVLIVTATTDIRFDVPLNRTVVVPKGVQGRKKLVAVILAAVVIFVLTIVFSYNHRFNEKENMPLTPKENAGNSHSKKEGNSLVTSDESAGNSHSKKEDNSLVTSDESAGNSHSKKKHNSLVTSDENAGNSHSKKEEDSLVPSDESAGKSHSKKEDSSSVTSDERTDILILHILKENQRQEVKSFKSHLEKLSIEMGYKLSDISIKLLEEIFPPEHYSTDLQIQTVLKKCNFIFVYISETFIPSNIESLGLKESSITDALKLPETKSRIKIVRNCETYDLPDFPRFTVTLDAVDFDYFKFDDMSPVDISNYKRKLKDCLKKI